MGTEDDPEKMPEGNRKDYGYNSSSDDSGEGNPSFIARQWQRRQRFEYEQRKGSASGMPHDNESDRLKDKRRHTWGMHEGCGGFWFWEEKDGWWVPVLKAQDTGKYSEEHIAAAMRAQIESGWFVCDRCNESRCTSVETKLVWLVPSQHCVKGSPFEGKYEVVALVPPSIYPWR